MYLWDVSTGSLLRTLDGHKDRVNSLSFSPDGTTLASGSYDDTARLWDVNTGSHLRTLDGHTDWIRDVSFSPDGTTIATASGDSTIRLWDASTGSELRTLTGHAAEVNGISFSPDSNTLATGSYDGTVLVWELNPSTMSDATEFTTESTRPKEDVTEDNIVNIQDLVSIASNLGQSGDTPANVNDDGIVNIQDPVLVAGALSATASAPALDAQVPQIFAAADVEKWLQEAQQLPLTDPAFQRGILGLEQLLATLTPKRTALLPNYPNPFNPETWIPYQLAKPADVKISIYAADGQLIRRLALGTQAVGIYESRSRAAYWDGKNASGESVASGIYFCTLTAGDFKATRRMLILK